MNDQIQKQRKVMSVLGSLLAATLLLATCENPNGGGNSPPSPWHVSIVEATDVSRHSLAVDADDRPHICYKDATDLMYARWTGTNWDGIDGTVGPDTVDTSGDNAGYHSMALDSDDRPHISYYDLSLKDLKYVHWTGTSWDGLDGTAGPDALDTVLSVGIGTSIALDGNDRPHISYYHDGNKYLHYVHWTGSVWDGLDGTSGPDVVDASGKVMGNYTVITLDSSDRPHICYYDYVNEDLKYVRWTGTTWDGLDGTAGPDVIVDGCNQSFSMVLDGSDRPHISYSTSAGTFYLHWTGTSWDGLDGTSGADSVGDQGGSNSSIALDSTDQPHIAFSEFNINTGERSLKYVLWTGTSWDGLEGTGGADLVAEGNIGSISMALDGMDKPHISFLQGNCLKYAHYAE